MKPKTKRKNRTQKSTQSQDKENKAVPARYTPSKMHQVQEVLMKYKTIKQQGHWITNKIRKLQTKLTYIAQMNAATHTLRDHICTHDDSQDMIKKTARQHTANNETDYTNYYIGKTIKVTT